MADKKCISRKMRKGKEQKRERKKEKGRGGDRKKKKEKMNVRKREHLAMGSQSEMRLQRSFPILPIFFFIATHNSTKLVLL